MPPLWALTGVLSRSPAGARARPPILTGTPGGWQGCVDWTPPATCEWGPRAPAAPRSCSTWMGTATWTSSPTSSTRGRKYFSATSPSDAPCISSRSGYAGRGRTARGWVRRSPWCCRTADASSKSWMGSRVTSPKATCPSISVSERRITRPRSRCAGHRGLVRRSAGPSPPEERSRSWSRSGSLGRPNRSRRLREPGKARVGAVPDLPHLAVRLGGGRAVPRRRCGAAQAQERQRAFRREREGACELTLRLRRTPSLEQHLAEQLMRRLHVGRRPELGRHPVLEHRDLSHETHRLVRRTARLPQQCLELQLKDVPDLVSFVARRRRSPVAVEGHEVGQGSLGPCPLAAVQRTEPEGEQVHRRIARTYSSQGDVPPQAPAVPAPAVHEVF